MKAIQRFNQRLRWPALDRITDRLWSLFCGVFALLLGIASIKGTEITIDPLPEAVGYFVIITSAIFLGLQVSRRY